MGRLADMVRKHGVDAFVEARRQIAAELDSAAPRCGRCSAADALVADTATGRVYCALCADALCRVVHGCAATIRSRAEVA